jgi:hypothetical protein
MVSFDYNGLDVALTGACIVLYALIASIVMLAVGWLTQRLQRKWLWSARNWLRCSLGIATLFFALFVAADVALLWRGVRVYPFTLAWPMIWLSLAVAAVLHLRRSAVLMPA